MSPTRYRARSILPITAGPIRDGWVEVERGVVQACGGSPPRDAARAEIDLGPRVVLPGLVNAHTHLELSSLRGTVRRADSMPAWARDVMQQVARGASSAPAVSAALREVRQTGTALVGDITNTLASLPRLETGPIDAVVFHELLGFNVSEDETGALIDPLARMVVERAESPVEVRAAAHAPYSVSPALFRALQTVPGPRSVHLAESGEEVEFLQAGTGPWRDVLEARGRWDGRWQPPGLGPVAYLESVGWLRDDTVAVHGVQLTVAEMDRLRQAGTTVVTCPRSNQWTGAGVPPLADFYARGMRVAVGTDSLASSPDLNLFSELAEMRRLAPGLSPARLLESATLAGARALGRAATHGAIEPGRAAALIAVALPDDVSDVEEYLVSGIDPEQIMWLDDAA